MVAVAPPARSIRRRVADVVAIPQPVNVYRYHGANMNLGVETGDQLTSLHEAEIPFRRWLLQTAEA